MERIRNFVKDLKEGYGIPRDGFDDYLKTCEKIVLPTQVPDLSFYWQIPEGEILHDVMIQPFYDSRTLKFKESDVLVVSYPKTGTTWTQEITYLLINDLNFQKAKSAPTEIRFPCMELPICSIRGIENAEEPRLLKTHWRYDLLPPDFIYNKPKIIYIARNPKDTIVSFYHFMKMVGYMGYSGTLEEFVDSFCSEKLFYSSFAKNVLSYWKIRNDDNVLFLFYEDLQKDLKSNVKKIAQFLGKNFAEEQFDEVVDYVSFDKMKQNPMANYSHGGAAIKIPGSETDFIRKGKTGDWRNYFNEELSRKVDEYVENHFNGSGIEFVYDI